MVEVQTIAVMTSLLLIVLTELSSVARDIDLVNVFQEQHTSILLPYEQLPQSGRFGFIHLANSMIAMNGVYWIFYLEVSDIDAKIIFAITLTLVWILLPVFEVEEYDSVLQDKRRPKSFLSHTLGVGIISVLTSLAASFQSMSLVIISTGLLVLNCYLFYWLLEQEMRSPSFEKEPQKSPRLDRWG